MECGIRVLVVGGGVGGLPASIALQQKGIEVEVYEAAPSFREAGAGIWMAPNATKLLDRLGLAEAINDLGRPYRKGVAIVQLDGTVLSATSTDKDLADHGFHTIAIQRTLLHQLLLNQVKRATTGKRFVGYELGKQGVTVRFEDGTDATGDVLVGADGLRSAVRGQLLGDLPLRYSGQTCWRFLSTANKTSMPGPYDMTEMWGNAGGLRVGSGLVSDDLAYTFITAKAPMGGLMDPGTVKSELHQLCRHFPAATLDLIDRTPDDAFLRNDLLDIAPLQKWHGDRVVLLGDAAHATLPNLGQGACQAVESAYSLAAQLGRVQSATDSNVTAAFEDYENERRRKAHRVTKMSWQIGQLSNIERAERPAGYATSVSG